MYQPLVPCPACDRHVRTTHDHCPFCAAALPADLIRSAVPSAPRRLGRAAAFAFGATVSLTGCGGDAGVSQGGTSTGSGEGGGATTSSTYTTGVTLYGGPPVPVDAGPPVPVDAGPPEHDAGMPDGGGETLPDGGGETLYGGPPPPFDGGGGGADYGSPPPPPWDAGG
jgi:hypothetical protein